MISTQDDQDPYAMRYKEDTTGGTFQETCCVRPAYLFAASERRLNRKICALAPAKLEAILTVLDDLLHE